MRSYRQLKATLAINNMNKILIIAFIVLLSSGCNQETKLKLKLYLGHRFIAISGKAGFLPLLDITRNKEDYCKSICNINDTLTPITSAIQYAFKRINKKYKSKAKDLDTIQIFIENTYFDSINIQCIKDELIKELLTKVNICKMDSNSFNIIDSTVIPLNIKNHKSGFVEFDSLDNLYKYKEN
jgi:hypothetical protein